MRVRLSEFRLAVSREFGDGFGSALVRDLVLGECGDRTAQQAIDEGYSVRAVWLALCRACEVPQDRQHGVGLRDPR